MRIPKSLCMSLLRRRREQTNAVLKDPGQVESNRIGLRICEKIMRQLGGTFEKNLTDDTFTATLTLPAHNPENTEIQTS